MTQKLRLFLIFASVLAAASLGCRAQTPPAGDALNRRIELSVRSQLNLSEEYGISLDARGKSEFPGYDQIPITFSKGQATRTIPYLISTDNKTLVRMDKVDLSVDPMSQVSLVGRPFRGGADAKVTIVVFDDLQCPFCAKMHREMFPQTVARYGDKIKIVYKDFPLPAELHPWALHAAIDSNCLAQANGDAYWSYVDFVHDHSDEIAGDNKNASPSESLTHASATLDRLAEEEGRKKKVDEKKLQACISAQDAKAVQASMHEGDLVGVSGTPLILVNGEMVNGWVTTDVLWGVIDRALKDAGVAAPPPVLQPTQQGQ